MMSARLLPRLLLTAVLLLPAAALAQMRFQEGRHYSVVPTPQATGLAPAGRIEVTEVFSYVCRGCYEAQGLVGEIKSKLPADAVLTYVHAGFNQGWPLFQRAHLTAQKLGIADRNHARVFTGIWESGDFPFFDPATGRPRQTPPAIRDAARFYAKGGGVTEADFAKAATTPEIDAAVKRTDELIKGWQVGSTPSFVVAGRYRIAMDSISSIDELHSLVGFLVGLERSRLQKQPAAKQGP